MVPVQSFRDLRVWQVGMDIVIGVFRLTDGSPKHEVYSVTSQMRRAAVSVPSNSAAGHTRDHLKEYLHHLSISRASLAELETQFEIAKRLEYISGEHLDHISPQMSSLGRQLSSLHMSLTAR